MDPASSFGHDGRSLVEPVAGRRCPDDRHTQSIRNIMDAQVPLQLWMVARQQKTSCSFLQGKRLRLLKLNITVT